MILFKKHILLPIIILLAAAQFMGCAAPAEPEKTEKPEKTSESVIVSSQTAEDLPEVSAEIPPTDAAATTEQAGEAAAPEAEPGLPDTVPEDLDDVAELNGYAASLWMDYILPNIFEAPIFSKEQIDSARKALVLIIAAEDKAIELEENNEHLYYIRGTAYAQCYYDTKDPAYKDKALEDLKKAADMGLEMAQTEYDNVSGK